jgi:hypothetical protein
MSTEGTTNTTCPLCNGELTGLYIGTVWESARKERFICDTCHIQYTVRKDVIDWWGAPDGVFGDRLNNCLIVCGASDQDLLIDREYCLPSKELMDEIEKYRLLQ